MARISVVTPCYDAERFIGQAIQSVLDQTYQDFEIIIVDDGSTDGSRRVIQGFVDPRIRLLSQENSGPAMARNTGVRAAAGEFVAFLDADDLALPHRFASQLAILEADPLLSVVGSGYLWIDETGAQLPWPHHSWQHAPDLNDISSWLVDCPFVPSATMLRRQAWEDIGGFDEELVGPEDWNFWLRLVVTGHRMTWQQEVVCLYRRSASSLSENADRMSVNSPEALRRVLVRPDFPPHLLSLGQKGLAIRYLDGTKRLYRSGKWEQGKASLETAIALDPDLIAGQPCRVEDEIVSAAMEPLVTDPLGFLASVFGNLPASAKPVQVRESSILARARLELLARGLQAGQYHQVLDQWGPELVRHPGQDLAALSSRRDELEQLAELRPARQQIGTTAGAAFRHHQMQPPGG
ncbi:MAG: glycosyltransferase, partial [Anaerolineae bacterium]